MRKSRFSDNEILSILKQAENGMPVLELCREHGKTVRYDWPSPYLFDDMREVQAFAAKWNGAITINGRTWP